MHTFLHVLAWLGIGVAVLAGIIVVMGLALVRQVSKDGWNQ